MQRLEDLLSGLNDPNEILTEIRHFAESEIFDRYAQATALKMVTHLFTDAGRTWRQAARKNSQGRLIYEALRRELQGPIGNAVRHQVSRNALMIRSLPLDIAEDVNEHILNESLKGTRSGDIAQQIKALFPQKSKAKADLIARTETSKASTALTMARSQAIGVEWYIWRTSEDSRVRESHRLMDDVLVRWSNPPSPEQLDGQRYTFGHYNCGDIFNCRCYPEPLIDLDMMTWPAKVYYGGSIQRMTRAQFEKMA